MATHSIPELSKLTAGDGPALARAMADLHDASIVWGATMAADLLESAPSVKAIVFYSANTAPGAWAAVEHANEARATAPSIQGLYDFRAAIHPENHSWRPGFAAEFHAAAFFADSWHADASFAPFLSSIAKFALPLAIEKTSNADMASLILDTLGRPDLRAKLEASRIAESAHPSGPPPACRPHAKMRRGIRRTAWPS